MYVSAASIKSLVRQIEEDVEALLGFARLIECAQEQGRTVERLRRRAAVEALG